MSQFGVGMIMAGIFTLQMMPILVAIPPAMVRSSVMMLVHPAISRERDTGKQKQLREKLMMWLHLHASKRENSRSSALSRSSSVDSMRSSLLAIEHVRFHRHAISLQQLNYSCRNEIQAPVSPTSTFTLGLYCSLLWFQVQCQYFLPFVECQW